MVNQNKPADVGFSWYSCNMIDASLSLIRKKWRVPVEVLASSRNPMESNAWMCGVIAPDDVARCSDNAEGALPMDLYRMPETLDYATRRALWRGYNIARISWLMENGWDDVRPVTVEMFVNNDRSELTVTDGNHRLSAAILLGHSHIDVCFDGDDESILQLHAALNPVEVPAL